VGRSVIIVTASDQNYLPLLHGLLASIEKQGDPSPDVGILNVGFAPDVQADLRARGYQVVEPNWDYDISILKVAPLPSLRAMTARPHLPKHFPGYEVYVWIDADAWVQDWSGIELYVKCAREFGFAITPECDRSYYPYLVDGDVISWRLVMYRTCFNDEFSKGLSVFPLINSGVFAAHTDAPHWKRYSHVLGEIMKARRELPFFAEQNTLNAIIRSEKIPTVFLPASHNWMCNRAFPMLDGSALIEPNPPYERLKVIHLTASAKNVFVKLKDRQGGEHEMSLRFGGKKGEEIKR
jgi:lipopolysaccharide biosynthesis glycosyltransferase